MSVNLKNLVNPFVIISILSLYNKLGIYPLIPFIFVKSISYTRVISSEWPTLSNGISMSVYFLS